MFGEKKPARGRSGRFVLVRTSTLSRQFPSRRNPALSCAASQRLTMAGGQHDRLSCGQTQRANASPRMARPEPRSRDGSICPSVNCFAATQYGWGARMTRAMPSPFGSPRFARRSWRFAPASNLYGSHPGATQRCLALLRSDSIWLGRQDSNLGCRSQSPVP